MTERGINLANGIPVRSGRVKKVEGTARANSESRRPFADAITVTRIYNSYEMAEQAGIVFPLADDGHLCPPNVADVIIRDPLKFRLQPVGVVGALHGSQVP